MEEIRNREKVRSGRDKLCYILVEKLIQKYGLQNRHIIQPLVRSYVDGSTDGMSASDLPALEEQVVEGIKLKKMSLPAVGKQPNQENSQKSLLQQQQQQQQQQEHTSQSASGQTVVEPPRGSEWSLLQQYQLIVDEEKQRKDQETIRAKKLRFKKLLDDQLAEATKYKSNDRTDDASYAAHVNKDVEKYHTEEALKRAIIHKKHQEELMGRKEQIADSNRRRFEEREALRLAEERNLQMAQDKIRQEQEAYASLKLKQKEMLAKIERENEENQRLRDIEKKKTQEEDQRLMAEYAARLDKQDFDRENAFRLRMENMRLAGEKFENEGAGKAIREEQIRTEQLLLKEQQRKEEADAAKEKKKADDARERAERALRENEMMKAKKREILDREKKEDEEFARIFRVEGENYVRDQQVLKQREKEKQKNYRSILSAQLDARMSQDKETKFGMEDRERQLNASTLKKVVDDPQIYSKIMHRMRIGGSSALRATTAPSK